MGDLLHRSGWKYGVEESVELHAKFHPIRAWMGRGPQNFTKFLNINVPQGRNSSDSCEVYVDSIIPVDI